MVSLFMKSPGFGRAAYLITIDNTAELEVVFGQPGEGTKLGTLEQIYKKERMVLTNTQLKKLHKLVELVGRAEKITGPLSKDAWRYLVSINGELKLDIYHGSLKNQAASVQELLEYVIVLSPLPINYDVWQTMHN